MMNTMIPMRNLDQVFNTLFAPAHRRCVAPDTAADASPAARVYEGEQEYHINLDMPGVERDNIEIAIEHETLSIKATRESAAPEGFQPRRLEYPDKLVLQRSFNLGREIAPDSIEAKLSDGVLRVTLKKSKLAMPRRIEIS